MPGYSVVLFVLDRSGRTGRANKTGTAIALFTPSESGRFRFIVKSFKVCHLGLVYLGTCLIVWNEMHWRNLAPPSLQELPTCCAVDTCLLGAATNLSSLCSQIQNLQIIGPPGPKDVMAASAKQVSIHPSASTHPSQQPLKIPVCQSLLPARSGATNRWAVVKSFPDHTQGVPISNLLEGSPCLQPDPCIYPALHQEAAVQSVRP